jgi:2-C-methyl-D-erythritol 2,4-cyclodiphosphate synthase
LRRAARRGGLPDIGHFFPNTDPAYRNIDSQVLLQRVAAELRQRGFVIVNCDATLIAERPKIYPRLAEMKAALARSAGIEVAQLGLKATTNEGSDDIGRRPRHRRARDRTYFPDVTFLFRLLPA